MITQKDEVLLKKDEALKEMSRQKDEVLREMIVQKDTAFEQMRQEKDATRNCRAASMHGASFGLPNPCAPSSCPATPRGVALGPG